MHAALHAAAALLSRHDATAKAKGEGAESDEGERAGD